MSSLIPEEKRCIHSIAHDKWEAAKQRLQVIKPLLEQPLITRASAQEAAQILKLSSRTIYTLIKRYTASGGALSSLISQRPSGGKGKSRLSINVEQIISLSISQLYLSKQKLKVCAIVEDVFLRCHKANIPFPCENTIRARIRALRAEDVTRKRQGVQEAHMHRPIQGHFPEVDAPLETFQMDHTPVDIIVVDEVNRQPIGRPYLTVAIDVYSRCIAGLCLSLEHPSAVSVGLCLANAVFPKEEYLIHLGIEGKWPMEGIPKIMFIDNAAEFHSEALRRGCEQYGISLEYRPVGQPHYGGIVERVIGTFMHKIHTLPGTTFSNTQSKGSYDSEKQAVFTLKELEKWLVLCIVNHYHVSIHKGIAEQPLRRWQLGIKGKDSIPSLVPEKFLIDFLPVIYRSLQRQGFVVDHITYYSSTLKLLIADRKKYGRFLIRRDPRDISHIFFWNPETNSYEKIGYRTLSYPAISLWEHQQAIKTLRHKRKADINEDALFQTIEALRHLTDEAVHKSKKARRIKARRPNEDPSSSQDLPETFPGLDHEDIKPFDDKEVWT